MATREALQEVIAANRARQQRARELNIRGGEALFPVLTREQMESFLRERLNGARNILEIAYVEDARLEPLDTTLIDRVLANNPDQVEIPGFGGCAVKYQEGRAPQVDIREGWQRLPDSGARLPGGREVAFYVVAGGYYHGPNTNVPELKRKAADQEAAHAFSYGFTKPALEVPNLSVEGVEVPAIREESYGTHALSGEKLVAYGALTYDSWYGRYQWNWYRTKEEAERAQRPVIERVTQLQAETRSKREEAEAREREETERRRTEEEQQRQLATGEATANFEAWHRRGGMTSNGDGWVIRADGSTRPHDDDDVRRYKSDGNYRWAFVARDELALRWSCGHMGDIDGNSTFEVVKVPVGGCTQAQLETVRRIETEEIGASAGAFGLNPEIIRERERLLSEVASAIPTCPASGERIEWTLDSLKRLLGSNGLQMPEGGSVYRLVNRRGRFDQSCDSREAQVVKTYFVGECGVVEALAYDKYGQWNLALRYRKRREGEKPEEFVSADGRISESATAGLFGGNVTVMPAKKSKRK